MFVYGTLIYEGGKFSWGTRFTRERESGKIVSAKDIPVCMREKESFRVGGEVSFNVFVLS